MVDGGCAEIIDWEFYREVAMKPIEFLGLRKKYEDIKPNLSAFHAFGYLQ